MILLWERYVSAMVFLWRRVHSAVWWLFHAEPKPKKERLLSPWEIAAIEIECGIEPSWTPPPVASLATRPPAGGFRSGGVVSVSGLMTYDPAKDGPIIYKRLRVECDDCETVEFRRLGDPIPMHLPTKRCPRHQEVQ